MPSRDPKQFVLDIERPHEQQLDNFVVGANAELLDSLTAAPREFRGYWIFGTVSSGRSHLLRGSCLAARHEACYVGCADYGENFAGLLAALAYAAEHGSLVAIDDVGVVAGHGEAEERLIQIYQRLLGAAGRLLIAHTHPASQLAWSLPDLASRLASLEHHQIQPLDDVEKAELLRQRAQNRGYRLSHAVLDYWLTRGPRDLGALLTDLDTLDKASLAHQRLVTVPLLKQVLGY